MRLVVTYQSVMSSDGFIKSTALADFTLSLRLQAIDYKSPKSTSTNKNTIFISSLSV